MGRRWGVRRGHAPAAAPVPPQPTAEQMESLLRQVGALRLALETDLTIAVAATEQGAPDLALRVVRDGQEHLDAVRERLRDTLGPPAVPAQRTRAAARPARPAPRRRPLAGLLAGSTAVAVLGSGVALAAIDRSHPAPAAGVAASAGLAQARTDLSALRAGAAAHAGQASLAAQAAALQRTLGAMLAQARTDPSDARTLTSLVLDEQRVLSADPSPQARQELAAAQALLARLGEDVSGAVTQAMAAAIRSAELAGGQLSGQARGRARPPAGSGSPTPGLPALGTLLPHLAPTPTPAAGRAVTPSPSPSVGPNASPSPSATAGSARPEAPDSSPGLPLTLPTPTSSAGSS